MRGRLICLSGCVGLVRSVRGFRFCAYLGLRHAQVA